MRRSRTRPTRLAGLAALSLAWTAGPWGAGVSAASAPSDTAGAVLNGASPATPAAASHGALCADPEPPPYYAFEVVPTGRVPGTARAGGLAEVVFEPTPFGVSLAPDGSYRYDLRVSLDRLPRLRQGVFTAWVTTTQVDRVRRLGPLDEAGSVTGTVEWNKFLVVVTLEPADDPGAETWSGPIVARGMSRSGMMHTMAGHGPFEPENCAEYGY